VLKARHVLLVASDVRWPDNQSVTAQFLGDHWRFTPIWAILAQKSGAPVVSVYCSMLAGGTHRLEFAEPRHLTPTDDIATCVQQELQKIESRVLKDPENANDYFFWSLDDSPAARELRVMPNAAENSGHPLTPGPHFDVDRAGSRVKS
jgi:lauroyl/myristoyl acyltransferase